MKGARGRPRAFDEDQIVDRAVDVFWRSGYGNTTTRDLEAALGVSQSSLYNAFGSKHGLLDAALDRYESKVGQSLLEPLESGDGGLDAIDTFFDSLVRTVTGNGRGGCMIINLMAEDGGADAHLSRRTTAYRKRIRAALRSSLVGAMDDGTASPGHVEERVDLLFGMTLGINVLARSGARRGDVAALAAGAHGLIDTWRP